MPAHVGLLYGNPDSAGYRVLGCVLPGENPVKLKNADTLLTATSVREAT